MDKKISTRVKSSIVDSIYYKEDKKINPQDKGSYVDLYQLFLFDKEAVVALGNKIYDNYDKNVISIPIYLVFENVRKIQKIGFFEIKANEYSQSLKSDNEINLEILDEPWVCPNFPCENLPEFFKYWISLHNCITWRAVKPLIFKPLKITNKKGREKIYLPPIASIAANINER